LSGGVTKRELKGEIRGKKKKGGPITHRRSSRERGFVWGGKGRADATVCRTEGKMVRFQKQKGRGSGERQKKGRRNGGAYALLVKKIRRKKRIPKILICIGGEKMKN